MTPPMRSAPSLIVSMKALRSIESIIAFLMRLSSNGGTRLFTRSWVWMLNWLSSQIACGARALMSAARRTEMSCEKVRSNSPTEKASTRVARLATMVHSMASRNGRPFFQ